MRMQITLLAAILTFALAAPSAAEVEWSVLKTLSLEVKPLDTALSDDNSRLFVLVEGGKVLVYSPGGALRETILLEKAADGIELSKAGDVLYVTRGDGKAVDIVRLEFIQRFTDAGSPARGPKDAPVVITVFSEFQ